MARKKLSVYATLTNELRVTQGALTEIHTLLGTIAERLRGGRLDLVDSTRAVSALTDKVVRLETAVAAMPELIEVSVADAIQVEVANVCPECQNTRYEPSPEPFNEFGQPKKEAA